MKKVFRLLTISMLIVSLLMTCACSQNEEGGFVLVQGTYGDPEAKKSILAAADVIIHATVTKKSNEYFTNPDGNKKAEDGTPIQNAWITEYEVRIHQQFKGDFEGDTITVRSFNGSYQTPEQFVLGAEGDFYLDEGQECVLALKHYEDTAGFGTGWSYISLYDDETYFLPTQIEGEFKNSTGVLLNIYTLASELS